MARQEFSPSAGSERLGHRTRAKQTHRETVYCPVSTAWNCFSFLFAGLVLSAYIFVSQVGRVACKECGSPVVNVNNASSSSSSSSPSSPNVGKGLGDAVKGRAKVAVKAFGQKDGDEYDCDEYPEPEVYDYGEEADAVVGMSLVVMAVCTFLITNTCPEYCFRKRIDLDGYKRIALEKKCGCVVNYDAP